MRSSMFLYRFGYQTPRQRKNNEAHGWDDMDSEAFFIRSEDREQALSWGDKVAFAFVQVMYGHGRAPQDCMVGWIEDDGEEIEGLKKRNDVPTISHGEMPDVAQMVNDKYPGGREVWSV